MRCLVVSLAVLAFVSSAGAGDRPNIVLVMADDLGWSDIGCFGGEIRTPNIDSLATSGLRFTQFYNNAICGPTRASLLTGLYCQQVGHAGYRWNDPKDFTKCVTIAEVLQRGGYRTMMVGKWQGRDFAVQRGFDRFFGPMCQAKISYFHEVQNNPFYLDETRWQLPPDFYLTEALNDYAVSFIEESATEDKPFFLYIAHIAPHWPLHARETDIAPYRNQYRRTGWDDWRLRRFERQREMGLIPPEWQLSQRLREFRHGCDTLIAAPHPQLSRNDREWLVQQCRDWAAAIDDHIAALEQGEDVIAVRNVADDTINQLIDELRNRAESVG